MECTSCQEGTLTPSFMDGQFRAHTCTRCGGNWILVEDFANWKERHPDYEFSNNYHWSEENSPESSRALLCPVTGSIMRKFRISAETNHRIDYSAAVGGIWLDRGEWELLKSEGLAGTLNNVVTQHWQNRIRQESTHSNFEAIYQARFGQQDYDQIKEIRAWLNSHPQRADLRSYLLAEDPYSAS